jgi:predicted branched-subunit amino acid permease
VNGEGFRAGFKAGLPLALVALLIGASFGVLARDTFGTVGATVMSAVLFAGSAQFASAAVLGAGGGAGAAILAGTLLNLRFLPMGVALAMSMRGSRLRRALEGQANVDASWAMASRGGGRFDVEFMLGATAPNYPAWVIGTLIGALVGDAIGDPEALGLDALFPAFFLALLWEEARGREVVAFGGALVALALVPFVPPGVPVIAACSAAVVVGVKRMATRASEAAVEEEVPR